MRDGGGEVEIMSEKRGRVWVVLGKTTEEVGLEQGFRIA